MAASSVTPVLRRSSVLVALALAAVAATTAKADTIVFQSNLSNVTTPSPNPNGKNFQLGYNGGAVAGIANTMTGVPGQYGFNLVFANGATAAAIVSSAILTGASSDSGTVKLDGALQADPLDTQDNGAFLALDSVYHVSPINIAVSTVAGTVYTVKFDWAGVQQNGFIGTTTDFLTVGFTGAASQNTATINVPQQGFTGWFQVTDTFTATTTGTSILSFLATGTPSGANQQPSMALLDNITVSQVTTPPPPTVPEPGSLMLLSTGLVGLGGYVRSRFKK